MVGHGGSSAGSCLTDPTSPIPSHCASVVATSTLRVKIPQGDHLTELIFLGVTYTGVSFGTCYCIMTFCSASVSRLFNFTAKELTLKVLVA